MKKDKRIGFLNIVVILFAMAAVILFAKAFLSVGDSGEMSMAPIADREEDSGRESAEHKETVVDFSTQSVSAETFNAMFTGSGAFVEDKIVIEGIPVNIFFLDNKVNMPLIIMQHGLTADKESMTDLAKSFAMQGYVVITPDAVGYGELADGVSRTLPDIIMGTADNFGKLISFCGASEYVDESRVGLCGVSMGALTSLYYSAYGEHNIKAVVSFCGTPDFASFVGTDAIERYHFADGSTKEKDKEKVKEMEEAMTSLSPYDTLLSDGETALFLMCGAADTVVPPQGNATFYQTATDAGKEVSLVVKENQGHTLELDEMYAALAFMVENL